MNVGLALFLGYLVLLAVVLLANHLIGRDSSLDVDE